MIKYNGQRYAAKRQADVSLSVDYENDSREWWDAGGQDLWDQYARGRDGVMLSDQEARQFLLRAKRIPGWRTYQYPNPVYMRFVRDEALNPVWASTRTALSSDGYARAVERANAAACRDGIVKAVQAIKTRVQRISDSGKLDGIDRLIDQLYQDISEARKIATRKKYG